MSRKVLISVVSNEAVAVAGSQGEAPSGELFQAVRRALHSAAAKAGGQLDQPGHGEACLSKPADLPRAVGIIACALLADGYSVELVTGGVAFDEPS